MRDSFVLYTSCRKQVRQLTNEQAGILFKAIFSYEAAEMELIPAMDGRTEMAFSFIQSSLDADAEKYEKVCEKRRIAGKMGGKQTKEEACSEKQKKQMVSSESKRSKRAPDNDYDSDFDHDIEKEGARKGTEEKGVKSTPIGFDEFWALYPKKRSRAQAEKAWEKLNPDSETYQAIMEKLPELIDSSEWKESNGRFIPYASTWLASEGWKDKAGTAEETKSKGGENRFCNFSQRTYDYDELEKRLLLRDGPGSKAAECT